jgi:hypothetical protein
VETVVKAFKKHPKVDLVGSSEMLLYFTDTRQIYSMGSYDNNHATNGTMGWRKSYSNSHKYDEYVTMAEEKSFLDGYKNPLIQLDPRKVMLVMSHSDNTFDKTELRTIDNPLLVKTSLKMGDFIKDPELHKFFYSL